MILHQILCTDEGLYQMLCLIYCILHTGVGTEGGLYQMLCLIFCILHTGVGTEGGLYQMLCLIYRNYPEVVALYDFKTPYTIPEEYYTDGTPGRAIDAAYLLLSQVLKSMNLLDRELLFYIHKDERR